MALQNHIETHRLPVMGKRPIHDEFGLWICGFKLNGKAKFFYKSSPLRKLQFYVFSHIVRGEGIFELPETQMTFRVMEGQVLSIPPNVVHRFGQSNSSFHEDVICFTGPKADLLYKNGILKTGIQGSYTRERPLVKIIEMSKTITTAKVLTSNLMLLNFINEINIMSGNVQNKSNSKLELVTEKIRNDLSKWWTVEEMAEMCGYSSDYFRVIFKEHFSVSPKEYIDQLKIAKAQEFLQDSSMPIGEIAGLLGYHNQFHFSRRFKELIGETPSGYRKENIKEL